VPGPAGPQGPQDVDEEGHLDSEESAEEEMETDAEEPASPRPTRANQFQEWQRQWAPADNRAGIGTDELPSAEQLLAELLALFPEAENIDVAAVKALVDEAVADNDRNLGKAAGLQWAAGFVWDPDKAAEGDRVLDEVFHGDLTAMIKALQAEKALDRLSEERIDATCSADNPWKELLKELVAGMPVFVDEVFTPNGERHVKGSNINKGYEEVAPTVNKLFSDWVDEGLGILLTYETAAKIPGVHFSSAGWVPKKGKECGRGITNFSSSVFGPSLNSEKAAEMAREHWGDIKHPTITRIVTMILDFYEREKAKDSTVQWEDVVLVKADLKAAYCQLNFKAEDVQKLAIELTDGLVLMLFVGAFGYVATPFCFEVVTNAIVFELTKRLCGDCVMFVDDIVACTLKKHLQQDISTIEAVCAGLLGPKALATEKTEWGPVLDILWWCIDLPNRQVRLARKNYLKAVYGYFTIAADGYFCVPEMERLASWASRYGLIFRQATSLTPLLYGATRGLKRRRARHVLRTPARTARDMWRLMLLMGGLQPLAYSRGMESFHTNEPALFMVSDSSLTGGAVTYYEMSALETYLDQVAKGLVGGGAVSLLSLGFTDDSSHQNCAEMISKVIGLIGLARLGIRDIAIHVIGDSKSALSWVRKGRATGDLARNASVVFVRLALELGITVASTEHLEGELNVTCDKLSRDSTAEEVGIPQDLMLDLDSDSLVQWALRLCNPRLDTTTSEGMHQLWVEAGSLAVEVRGIC
jgi:hypothetical protein